MVDDVNSTALMVSFSAPSTPNGIIIRYDILYVSVSDGSPVGEEVTVMVEPNETGMYTEIISGLVAFTMYRVQAAAVTSIGQGVLVDRIASTDPTASSPPTAFAATTITSDSVTLTWGYPETPRGVIQGYVIRYHLTGSLGIQQEDNITLSTLDDDSMQTFTVSSLTPFTLYSFTVRAYSFGQDPFVVHQGAESTTLDVVTDEAGNFQFLVVQTLLTGSKPIISLC